MDFTNKNVLITGASRGIGKAAAIAFAQKGAKVGLNYRSNDEAAELTLKELSGEGHQLFKRDISHKEETQALINDFVKAYDHLDVLVNNAGISIFHEIANCEGRHGRMFVIEIASCDCRSEISFATRLRAATLVSKYLQ